MGCTTGGEIIIFIRYEDEGNYFGSRFALIYTFLEELIVN